MTTTVRNSSLLLLAACLCCWTDITARAVTCGSFVSQKTCDGITTDSGICAWNETTQACVTGEKLPEGQVAITSFESDLSNGTFCTQESETGNCRGMFPSWYYNAETNSCDEFIYGGCGGNANRFETGQACVQAAEEFCPNQTKGAQVTVESYAHSHFFSSNVLGVCFLIMISLLYI